MSVKNKKLVMNFLDGFRNGRKQECTNYLTEDVKVEHCRYAFN